MSGKRFDMDGFVKKLEEKGKPEPTESTRRADTKPTESTRKQDFSKRQKTELERISVRLRSEDIGRLRNYFESRDLTLSQGIRMIIKEYIEKQGI